MSDRVRQRSGVRRTIPRALLTIFALAGAVASSGSAPGASTDALRREAEQLLDEGRYEAAGEVLERLRAACETAGDEAGWTFALVRRAAAAYVQHGPAVAAMRLREAPWPRSDGQLSILRLYEALFLGLQRRLASDWTWRRDRPEGLDVEDLRAWSVERLGAATDQAYAAAWRAPRAWLEAPAHELVDYVASERGRGTRLDLVAYLWVDDLVRRQDASSYPDIDAAVDAVDLELLLGGDLAALVPTSPVDPEIPPGVRAFGLLAALQARHREAGRVEDGFRAWLARLRLAYAIRTSPDERARIADGLEAALAALPAELEAWSEGTVLLAGWERDEDRPDALVRARTRALAAEAAQPTSRAGRRAAALRAAIEAPGVELAALAVDGPGRPSFRLTARNLDRVYFRAWRVNGEAPAASERDDLVSPRLGEPPSVEWSVEVARGDDYRDRITLVTPPLGERGAYAVVASSGPGFARGDVRRGLGFAVGSMVVTAAALRDGVEARVFAGEGGEPLAGAELELRGCGELRPVLATAVSDRDGRASFPVRWRDRDKARRPCVLAARRGEDRASSAVDSWWGWSPSDGAEETRGIVFTDRRLYRPGQALSWRVVAARGVREEGRWETLPEVPVTLSLLSGGEVVAKAEATTDAFGAAAGELAIPAKGFRLGGLELEATVSGAEAGEGSWIQVEEVRRPTFEVTLEPPAEPLGFGRPATLVGRADYLFGAPVTEGTVAWTLTDSLATPVEWRRSGVPAAAAGHLRRRRPVMLANGTATLGPAGGFEVAFVPRGGEELALGFGHRYDLSVEVTAAGGETRKASRLYEVGIPTARVWFDADPAFFEVAKPIEIAVHRVDSSRTPLAQPGASRYRLLLLRPPTAELRREDWRSAEAVDPWRLADELARWQPGGELRRGTLGHGTDGRAELEQGGLPAGAYRLEVETADAAGLTSSSSHDFLVLAPGYALPWPAFLVAPQEARVGKSIRLLLGADVAGRQMLLETFHDGRLREGRWLRSSGRVQGVDVPIGPGDRGGVGFALTIVRDFVEARAQAEVRVPWSDRRLDVDFVRFRETLRPGDRERWSLRVRDARGEPVGEGVAQVVASMYDRSLDLVSEWDYGPHRPPRLDGLDPYRASVPSASSSARIAKAPWRHDPGPAAGPGPWQPDRLVLLPTLVVDQLETFSHTVSMAQTVQEQGTVTHDDPDALPPARPSPDPLRRDFRETAFWAPRLLTGPDGTVSVDFTVPDAVTEWQLWAHAVTRDLRFGEVTRLARSRRELQVRPQVPRFFRAGDRLELPVVVDNLTGRRLRGRLDLRLVDPETGADRLADFGLEARRATGVPFRVPAGQSVELRFPLRVPRGLDAVAVEALGRAGELADGERRPVPILPARAAVVESRSVALRPGEARSLRLDGLAGAAGDPTALHERLVVTVEAGLVGSVLSALPYLVRYPYDCVEQTLNRYLTTSIVARLLATEPRLAALGERLATLRGTVDEPWAADDPNRVLALEETPWAARARGGAAAADAAALLDPQVVAAERAAAIAKLRERQGAEGGFSWMPGGPPSPYMTLYVLRGFARGLAFGVEPPRDVVEKAFGYVRAAIRDAEARDGEEAAALHCFVAAVLAELPDLGWTGVFGAAELARSLDDLAAGWRRLPRLSRAQAAFALHRGGRVEEARTVLRSVLDGARTDPDLGTFWLPEEDGWCWYRDSVEGHALVLRALLEISPDDPLRHGLVQWLLLDKRLGHWRSTRTTAEVLHALVAYLEREGALGAPESVAVRIGGRRERLDFAPDDVPGERWVVVPGDELDASSAEIEAETTGPGVAFASATWHATTEALPAAGSGGGLFALDRRFFAVRKGAGEPDRVPLSDGDAVRVGEVVEVELTLRSAHPAEFVHLRDPRPAGFEPESTTSGYRWDGGVGFYLEVRDSGANLFLDRTPAGPLVLRHRLRATLAGTFRAAPAVVQSMYAPEFAARSSGAVLAVGRRD